MPMNCPKCGCEQPEGNMECIGCGVIFSKIMPAQEVNSGWKKKEGDLIQEED